MADACRAKIEVEFGELTNGQLDSIMDIVRQNYNAIAAAGDLDSKHRLIGELGEQALAKHRAKLAADKLRAIDSEVNQLAIKSHISSNWLDAPVEGFTSFIEGTKIGRKGAADSFDVYINAKANEWTNLWNSTLADLDAKYPGLGKRYHRKMLDKEMSEAIVIMGKGGDTSELADDVLAIATAYRDTMDHIRIEMNKAGANIGSLDDFITSQRYDRYAIQSAGRKKFTSRLLESVDWERTFGVSRGVALSHEGIMQSITDKVNLWYENFATGHFGEEMIDGSAAPRSVAASKAFEAERKIHFRDGATYHEFFTEFGSSADLEESMAGHIHHASRSHGLMVHGGINYRANLRGAADATIRELKRAGDEKSLRLAAELQDYSKPGGEMDHAISYMDGSARTPENMTVDTIGRTALRWMGMTKLGAAVLSALPTDPVNMASGLMERGMTPFRAQTEVIKQLYKAATSKESRALAGAAGAAVDAHRLELLDMVYSGGGGGHTWQAKTNRVVNAMSSTFATVSGIGPQTTWARTAQANGLGNFYGSFADDAFDSLPRRTQISLKRYGIEAADWDAVRAHVKTAADGDKYILPGDIPDSKLAAKWSGVVVNSIENDVIQPRARIARKMMGTAKAGTWQNIVWRMMMQFKSFPVSAMDKLTGFITSQSDFVASPGQFKAIRTMAGAAKQTLAENPSEYAKLAFVMSELTAMGYVAMCLKDISKGREPRTFGDDYEKNKKLLFAAFTQGGGAGILGDFAFGEVNRFGGGLLSTLAGPTAGTVSELHGLYARVRDGDDAAASTFKSLWSLIPGQNHFASQGLVNWLFVDRVMDTFNPGSANRRERQRLKDFDQSVFLNNLGGFN